MEKSEIEFFTSLLLEKERDIAFYKQAMINFISMLRNKKMMPAILLQGSNDANDLVDAVIRAIKDAVPRGNNPSREVSYRMDDTQ